MSHDASHYDPGRDGSEYGWVQPSGQNPYYVKLMKTSYFSKLVLIRSEGQNLVKHPS